MIYKKCIFIFFFSMACSKLYVPGILHVSSLTPGNFEIYSISGDATLQFVSERLGKFNEDLALSPGRYLIMADCSNKVIVIHPGERTIIPVHMIDFVYPKPPGNNDLFSIQCSRYEKSHLRQHIVNRYQLHMFSGEKDLLVGMLPLFIQLPEQSVDALGPSKLSFGLAALRVKQGEHVDQTPYFVSASDNLRSITQAQKFNQWQFLLPGRYNVEINGTQKVIDLKESELLEINPGGIILQTSSEVDLALVSKIKGEPFWIYINKDHPLEPNTFYSVLPGPVSLRVPGSNRAKEIEIKEGGTSSVVLRSLLVDQGCSPWEWECLGSKEIDLYLPEHHYPFLTSASDLPIFFIENNVHMGIVDSFGLRFELPADKRDVHLKVGKVTFEPRPVLKGGQYTDLARVEAAALPFSGFSRDILPDQPTTMTLVVGNYLFARFTSFTNQDFERNVSKQRFSLKPGQHRIYDFSYAVLENKMKNLQTNFNKRRLSREQKQTQAYNLNKSTEFF